MAPSLVAEEQELRRLMAFVEFAEGFDPALVQCDSPELRSALIAEVAARTQALGFDPVLVDFGEQMDVVSVRDELRSRLRDLSDPHPGRKRVLLVWGLEQSVCMADRYPPLLVWLNYQREAFFTDVPHPSVLWLTDPLLTKLSRVAPDFWSWCGAAFRFPVPEALWPGPAG